MLKITWFFLNFTRFIFLEECSHIVEVSAMDHLMEELTRGEDEIGTILIKVANEYNFCDLQYLIISPGADRNCTYGVFLVRHDKVLQ